MTDVRCSFREQCIQTLEEFKQISSRLKEHPKGIEELTELREFMDDIPAKLETLATAIKAALHIFDVLEGFKYKVTIHGIATHGTAAACSRHPAAA